ncbi:ankyrin repeat domain-containing protein [Candidatus Dependentiae bacterium]|nr:MAG: ankyrin repeat domain-containing protein [Candidatus Dependentiae bacterium]
MKKLFFILGLLGISVNYYFLAMIKQPVSDAVRTNNIPRLKELLNTGYTYEHDDEKRTPLHLAAIRDNIPTVRLLSKKIDPQVRDMHKNTAFFYAILYGRNPIILHLLVDSGAKVNSRGHMEYRPLQHALYKGAKEKTISFLLARGAKSGKPSENCDQHYFWNHKSPWTIAHLKENNDAIRLMQESDTLLSTLNNELLKQAGKEVTPEKINSVRDLLDQGAQVSARDENGQTPLDKALDNFSKSKNPNIIKLLVSYGSDLEPIRQGVLWDMLIHILPAEMIQ